MIDQNGCSGNTALVVIAVDIGITQEDSREAFVTSFKMPMDAVCIGYSWDDPKTVKAFYLIPQQLQVRGHQHFSYIATKTDRPILIPKGMRVIPRSTLTWKDTEFGTAAQHVHLLEAVR